MTADSVAVKIKISIKQRKQVSVENTTVAMEVT